MSDPLRKAVPESSLVQVLRARALEHPERPAYIFLAEGEEEAGSLTFAELDERARALGAFLQRLGMVGERALLLYPPGLDFISGFLGCLHAGVAAVPAYPPRSERMLPRLRSIVQDARPAVALTTAELSRQLAGWAERLPELSGVRWVATDELDVPALAAEWREPEIDAETLAFLQYTSGSTAQPKGVEVSHGNLLHNEAMIQAAFAQSERSVIVGWLPLYHDMGLIGNVLQPLYAGARCVLMSPVAFLQRPLRWLRAITRYRATTSGGPNFAYELCVKRISGAERHGLDLSTWEVAFNGAEPVRAETLERFAEAFSPFGFRREAFYPCYGLAEATLFVSGGRVGELPVLGSFRSADLERDRVRPAAALESGSRRLVGCGGAWSGQEIAIVDPETGRRCGPERVGEIWVSGASVALGYWDREEESERTFRAYLESGEGPYLRTGDLGFLREGELYVTGRLKDLIILRGRNLYPQDLELTAEASHGALRAGCSAAFAVEAGGEERLVIVAELERRREGEAAAAVEAVRRAVAEEHEAQVHEVVLVRMGSVPKTSSGKIQRHACRAGYLGGSLEVVERSELAAEEPDEVGQSELEPGLLAPLSPAERRAVLESWLLAEASRALGVPASRIDPARPLTALGLDSLGAVEIKSRIETALGVPVSLGALLEGASLVGLAVDVLERLAEASGPGAAPAGLAPVGEETGEHPLSYGQRGLWYLHRLAPESLAYHLAGAGRVHGSVDAGALARALAALVVRHPALRTTFGETAQGPVQRVHEELAPELVVVDLDAESDLEARLHAEIWRRFDLERGPLVRLGLLRPAAGEPVLFLAIHHLVCDFGSLAVIARDLGALYSLESGRPAPALTPLALRYSDHVRWQEEWMAGPRGERLWAYWREVLAPGGSEPPWLDLPSDRPRPVVQTWSGDARRFRLADEAVADLNALARRHGATLYMVLLAGFEAVLARYTGQRNLLIGSPTTGRSSAAVADLVGYFVNPVALRVALPEEPSFTGLLDEVRRVVVGAFEYQDFPFAALAERLQPQRDPSRPPLFDVVFTFQKAPGARAELGGFALGDAGARLSLGGLAVESLALQPMGAPYSLDFMVAEVAEGLGALLRFNSDLFDGATMERLAGHYRTLLAGALADPLRPLSELPLLTAEESDQLLVEWTRKGPEWPADVLLHELFEAQARRTPEATALIAGRERLTYRDLDARAERMARRLQDLVVAPEVPVGIFLHRTSHLPVSLLGVLKAGGAYVPLDPAYPRERLEAILGDAKAPVVVTEGALLDALPAGLGARVVCVDRTDRSDRSDLAHWPVRGGRLAYVIYTSGSTGRPKGIAIEHRSAAALMHWSREAFSAAELSGVLASTSVCFDMSVFELFAPLAWGGTVILADNALALSALPSRDEVTLIDTVPSAMAELLRQGAVPRSVRTVNLGGEPLRGVLARQVHALGWVERLLNLYGPSEDTTFTTIAEVAEVGAEGEPTIGRILPNSWGYVVDRQMRLVPVGVPGELYLAGAGLSRGYLGRPDMTAERYVPDPFSAVGGERLYRTGDLVRWRRDGELEYLGRLDHQVKVRGFRVELGEIEAALLAHPAVQDAAVLALGEGAERRLVAYGAARQGLDSGALRGTLKEKLPEYMVPSAVVVLDALPLTPNGKIDRRALARIDPDRTAPAEGYVAPRTLVEARLAEIWAAVLGLERVGIQDDFFELGGHSLLATQMVSRVRESFGVELPLRRLLEVGTVEALARELDDLGARAAPPLRPVPREGDLPLSFAQERMWFLHRLEPESAQYNVPGALRLRGQLDVAVLRTALGEIVRRHEALRTTFPVRDGRPVQQVSAGFDLPVPLVETAETELHPLTLAESRQPFDLTNGPVLRAQLLRLGADDHALLVTMHHIVADGWSIGVLLRELSALYSALVEGRPAKLPELPIQYADFAVWQRQWLSGRELDARLAWWRESLAGAPTLLELPADRTRPVHPTYRGALCREVMPSGASETLKDFAQRRGATPFMVLLSLLGALFRRYTGQQDILVGSPVAGRDQVETEGLIGFFVNTLVMRVDLTGDPGFAELLDRVRQMSLGAISYQDLPFEKLVEELSPERDASRTPLFQVVLAHQSAPAALPALPGLSAEVLESYAGVSRFDLTLFVRETSEGFVETAEYALDLFDAPTIERLLGHLQVLVAGALANPLRPLTELPLLTAEESDQLLLEWTRRGPEWPADVLLHELFEAQVRRTPEATALIAGRERLSYRELDARAERMALRLQTLGVAPEVPVGIFLHRTSHLLVSLLGVLKAGGAYVPLDPAYPRERLEAILGDAEAPVVVTEGALADALPAGLGARVVCVDRTDRTDRSDLACWPVRAGRLAYVIYTSGSTGRPKGIAIEHRSAAALMHWSREAFSAAELSGVLASTSVCFDMSVFELFAPLAWGGTVILAENALALAELPAKEEVTLIDTVPSAMAELLRQGAVPRSVRTVNLGGEPLRGALARQVHALGWVERLLNLYGPSEDTTFTTIAEVAEVGAEGEPTIGRILPNSWGYVVDRQMRLVPVGVPGELYLAGAGLSRGYLGRPDMTAERYVPDPFSAVDGERLYKTGDLVRWRRGGELEYLGRLDHQVKVRGFRVELGEIEAALLAYPALEDAAVLALGESGERWLVAYVVAREGSPDVSALRRYLKEKLPEYMVPSVVVELEVLPLTPNGKIDRRALARIDPDRSAPAEGHVVPRTSVEARLAEIWAEVLGLQRVGVQDDFFDLGGHSLLATQLISRVRESFGVELPLRLLFEISTVEGLARELAESAGPVQVPPLRPVPRDGDLPLSFAQERLWFLEKLEPGSPIYNLPVAARLTGALDVAALVGALGEIVRRHEALRTVFSEAGGRPVQRIAPWSPLPLPTVDLSARTADLDEWMRVETRTPFDLASGALARGLLLRLGESEHVVVLTFHHIAADGWSVEVFLRELSALYKAFAAGRPSPLPELAIQYADFAVWQREWLRGEILETQLAYWRNALAGLPPALDLPTDRPRPPLRGTRGGHLPVSLQGSPAEEVRALAKAEDATPFMVLLAGLQALLSRLSGQEDLAVGSAVANRNRIETEPLIGFFANMLVLRSELAGDPNLRVALARARVAALGAYSHQDVPFEKLVEELAPERDPSRTPLFQVSLVLQNAAAPPLELPGLKAEPLPAHGGGSRFDLTLLLRDGDEGFVGLVEYASDLFDAATVERFLGYYRTLLAGALAEPDRPLSELPLLTQGESLQLLAACREERAEWPADALLHELFEVQARRTPEATALIAGRERLTYRELDERANRMARRLQALGVAPEVPVGIFLRRTSHLPVSMLGVLKAGGAYVPLDPAYPRERLEAILGDAKVPVVVTEEALLDALPAGLGARLVCVDRTDPSDRSDLARWPVRAGRLAYVIYTSGSTGRPKGIAIEHRSAAALMHWSREAFSAAELSGVLASTSVCFDMSVFELFAPLAWGGTVILADNALALAELPAKDEVRLIDTVPSAMAELLRQGAVPRSVRTVNLGGEPLRGALARQVHALGWVERLLNLYGPSEDTTFTSVAEVGAEGEPTIGRILPNSWGYVLDRNLGLAPVGVAGELYLGGAGLSRGYLGRPELTAERYVPDPFATVAGERLYRTGDLVRLRRDGELEYLGRLDRQVKVRGFRVELGEIEAALLAHPAVQDAAVLALGEGGERRLVAYVVAPGRVELADLRGYLKEKLPEYMVPSVVVELEALPLTPNGKIDRRALALIEPDRSGEADGYVAPRTPVESRLAEIWSEVLGIERVGIQDDFFDLGGHSLLATQLVSRVREVFGVELPLRRLFEVATIEGLAQDLEAAAGSPTMPPLRPVDRSGKLPPSFAQERLWFLDRLEPGSPLYNMPAATRLAGSLDVGALTAALGEIVRRHEALRTVFVEAAGRPVQRIAPWSPFPLPVVDLSALPTGARRAAVEQRVREEARRPFDLGSGALARGLLLRLAAAEHVIVLNFHHIAADGWSVGVFLRELSALYRAFATGRPSPLPELPIQYADFAVWQREWLRGEILEKQLAYWRAALAGLPPALDLPTDRPRPAVRGIRGVSLPLTMAEDLAASIRELAQDEEVTPFMILLAGLQALLARLSGQDDLAVGSVVANRNRIETEPLIGFFVNTLVLRGELAGDPSLLELLVRTRAVSLGAYSHQDVPFEKLVEELAPERDPGRTPLFQVALALQNATAAPLELPGLQAEPLVVDAGVSRFDLTLLLRETAEGFTGAVEYASDLFDAATVERLLGYYRTLLEGALAEPERPLSELPLLSTEESRQLLAACREERAEWPADALLHELFEAQARRTPEATALIAGRERLSYRDLDEQAERMAQRLQTLGVAPEVPVGIFLRRTSHLPVSLLGVLKAGGAYVPLDPAYPRERLEAILGDAQAPVVVTEEALLDALPAGLGARLVSVDRTDRSDPSDPSDLARWLVRGGRLAYVIYTSGSTGRPKGIAIEHRSAVALMHWSREAFSAAELSGVLASTSVCFDMSVFELFAPLAWGGTVILADNALALAELPAREEVRLIDTVPSAMAELLRQGAVPRSVRTVNLGGEPLRGALARQVHALGWVERLLNLYGPSEDTTFTSVAEVGAEGEPTIGRILPNSWGYVLDRNLGLAPVGVAGELYLGGAGLSRGYLGRPELTAERYVPDPFAAVPGERLYRTGDLVRLRRDGELEYLGRLDRQVKVRGFRVELGEIEAALLAHPAVQDAAVLALGEGGERRLVAYVVVAPKGVELADLRGYLKEKLPEYMVPSVVVALEALPLTPNGKIDRRALALVEPDRSGEATGYVAPRTAAESRLAELWSEVLGIERIGIQDDFFDLGGHSLLATQLVSRVREVFGVELPLRRLFEVATVEGLAPEIEILQGGDRSALAPQLERGADADEYPLSFAQERLWILDRFEPGNAAYNLPAAVRLCGELDAAVLERSLAALVARQESLRTVFASRSGRAVQIIAEIGLSLPRIDLRALPAPERDRERERLQSAEALRPFDLGKGPLLRACLVWEGEADHVLLLTLHHIVADGWSVEVFVRELASFYAAFRLGKQASLPELPVRYVDYATWQRRWLDGPAREAQLAYWRERLAGAPQSLELPTDRPRPAVRTHRGGQASRHVPGAVVESLHALARREGASLFMVLLAAFQVLLQRLSGEEDVLVGSPIAGRGRGEVEGLIGVFLNTLVLRSSLAGDPSVRELLGRTREAALGAYAHQDVPFEMLLDELKPERDLSRTPLFQVFFNMLNLPAEEIRLPGLTLETLPAPDMPTKFDLTLYAQPLNPGSMGLRFDLAFNRDLFDGERIEIVLEQLCGLLARFGEDPEARIGSLSLLTPAAAAVLPDPRAPLGEEWWGAVHEKLSCHARRQPERLALRDRHGAWTYGELEARSNRLAHQLVAAGLRPEDLVAIYAHRSATLVWAVLGALKAGGAFLILDPAYPPARLVEILQLASPRAWLRLTEAGRPPAEVEELVTSLPDCIRVDLHPAAAEERVLAGQASEPPAVEVGPDHLAVMAFTSGSTGVPKGILGRHGPLSHFLPWQVERFGLSGDDRFSMLSGLSHDPLQRDLFTPLWLGASLAIPDPLAMGTPGRLAEWMRREEVSVAHLTPAMAQILTERPPGAPVAPDIELPALRYVLLVGDVLTRRDVLRIQRLAPRVTVVNLYGSTETQRAVSYHVVADETAGGAPAREVLPLGQGMRDVQLLVLNACGALAGIGEVGEIGVRSPHLARGYLGDEALTRERFQVNPFTGEPGDRIYRTGDLGRYLPDGGVSFMARADGQVKIRGFRIEPGEIEALLGRLAGVREAVVLARGDAPGDRRLVAYVTLDPAAGEVPALAQLRSFLKARLPAYMVPAGFVILERLPVTPNGKVDRKALLRIDDRHRESDVDYKAPQTAAELTITTILQEVLKIDRVGVDDNFFDLGGNSLLMVQVHGQLQERFGREILLVEIFNNPTVRALAAHLEGNGAAAAPPAPSADRSAQLRLGQDRMRHRFQQRKRQ